MTTYYIDLNDFTLPADGSEEPVAGFVRRDDSGVPGSWERGPGARLIAVTDDFLSLTVPTLVGGSINQTAPEAGDILTVSGANETGTATYQWQDSPDNVNWSPIAGQTNATLDTSGITPDDYVRRAVNDGAQATAFSSSVQISAAASATVGAIATTDSTAGLTLSSPFVGANPTAITWWGIFREASTGSNRDMMGFANLLNEMQARSGGGIRLKVAGTGGNDNATEPFGGTYAQGDQIAFIASFDAATDAWVIAVHEEGQGWQSSSGTITSVTDLGISGEDFFFNPNNAFAADVIRFGVAIDVALDGISGTVQDAMIQNGTDTPVTSAATLQALMSGGTVGIDMYGGTARFNAGTNNGAWGNMTANGTWT